jgi:lipooligosaccharide transport system permease protein
MSSHVTHYALKVWYRDFIVWTRYWWTSLVGAIGEPLLYFLAMGYGLGSFVQSIEGMSYIQFLAPGLVASSIMHSASFETTYSSYTRMEIQKTYHAIAVTPVSLGEVVLGEILWGATKSLLAGGVMFAAVIFLGLAKGPMVFWAIPVFLVEALLFSSLGMLVTSFAKDYDYFTYYFTLLLEPMFLFSGTFFPIRTLPVIVQKIAWLLPLGGPVALTRRFFTGYESGNMVFSIIWLVVLTAGITAWSIHRMVKRLVV